MIFLKQRSQRTSAEEVQKEAGKHFEEVLLYICKDTKPTSLRQREMTEQKEEERVKLYHKPKSPTHSFLRESLSLCERGLQNRETPQFFSPGRVPGLKLVCTLTSLPGIGAVTLI